MSRFLWSRRDDARADALNDGTLVFGGPFQCGRSFDVLVAPQRPSFRELFWRDYADIQALLNGHTEPGLGLVVAGREGLEASAWFEAREGEINPLIIGRHSAADVFLPSDPGLSLRHLAVMLYRPQPHRPSRFRVLDLRTPSAFTDEGGTPLDAVEAEGPLMLHCASFAILFLPTGGSSAQWPAEPAEAWKRIPERRYLESASADPDRWPLPGAGDRTLVHTFPGPVFPPRAVADSDCPRGEILVRSPSGQVSLRLTGSIARQGLLLGRYDRCDTGGLPVLSSPALSRVHVLLIEMEGTLYAVDTASTNGSSLGGSRMRSVKVEPGLRLWLAGGEATVEWRPFH